MVFILLQLKALELIAQDVSLSNLRNHVTAVNTIRELKPIEKLYLQTDKPYYTTGDTLRFKAYLLNADYLTPSNRSGLLYVELDGADGKAAKRIMVPVENGIAWGDIALDSKDIPAGSYTFRAYTNWQRNFGEDYIFKKEISITATKGESLLVKAGFSQKDGKVEGVLQFTSLDGHIQVLKDMQLKVMNGKKNLSKDKLTTNVDGTVKVNFTIPQGANISDLSIKAQDVSKGITDAQELTVPVTIKRLENTDVQFMPEGSSLVAGIKTKVGFKAIGEDGKGTNVTGIIIDSKQNEVATINTSHAGMGSFEFIPTAGETYSAKLNGINKLYKLPIINTDGTALKVTLTTDSLNLTIAATSASATTRTTYYLIGQSRGVVCYAEPISFDKDQTIKKSAARDQFPTGIARFTLINSNHQPVNERQVFINHQDNLNITIQSDKTTYTTRDSVGLTITVKDKVGKPVQGNFSLAVTDNTQVKTDSLVNNIVSNLLLTSDLKGNIEEPNYYFINPKQKEQDLDNLLLTQGWVGYDWQDVFYPGNKPIIYSPENAFTVNGTVTNAFGKPIQKSNVVLVANRPLLFKDTLTNSNGRFTFKGLFPVDTAIYKLQARNKNGKEMNVKIEMDNFKVPEFPVIAKTTPWYTNIDSTILKNTRSKAAQIQAIANYNGEGKMLQEVNITAKKIIPSSKNLNGLGEADQIIDEEELVKANKMTLEEVLYKKIKGFGVSGTPQTFYNVFGHPLHIVFDGIDLHYFFNVKNNKDIFNAYMLYVKKYLTYYTAEDVIGIEFMFQTKYTTNYLFTYGTPPPFGKPPIYLEITTRSKKGPFMQVTPGTYLFKTIPFSVAKQFYSPKYTIKNKASAMGTDMRSTIFWEPNVITDKEGKATVSFYSADKSSNYTVIMEGSDMNGQLGYGKSEIKVH